MASAWRIQGRPREETQASPVLEAIADSYGGSAMDTPTSQQARDDDVPTPVFRLVAVACRPGRPRSDPRRAAGAEVRRRPGHGDRARPPVWEYRGRAHRPRRDRARSVAV